MVEFLNTPLELKLLICGLAFFGFAICFSLYRDEKKDFNEKLKENKDMKNSYVTLHRTLDTQIQALESATTINSSLITDLKKKKLQLKEHIELGTPLPVGTQRKLNSMLNSNKVERKSIRKQRKVTKHALEEELKRRLSQLSS